jgi:hypothetical protein
VGPRRKKPTKGQLLKPTKENERRLVMTELNDALARVTAEANGIFDKMRTVVEEAVAGGATQLEVVEVARKAGLQLDEKTIDELQIDRIIYVYPWLPWHHWWPWRPLWCWWWHQYHPWYRCCPWWWYRCHWHPC